MTWRVESFGEPILITGPLTPPLSPPVKTNETPLSIILYIHIAAVDPQFRH